MGSLAGGCQLCNDDLMDQGDVHLATEDVAWQINFASLLVSTQDSY
jgi:hypothetical protein